MSFGFSATDFWTLATVITNVIKSVHEATGSTAQYRSLVKSFDSLVPTLDIIRRQNAETGNQTLRVELQKAVENVSAHIKAYEETISGYEDTLASNPRKPGRIRRFKDQLRWKLQVEDTIGPFLDILSVHINTINTQLNAEGM